MFRFTIRELVMLTAIVAMGAAWWVDHWGAMARADAVARHARRLHDTLTAAKTEHGRMEGFFSEVKVDHSYLYAFPGWQILDEPIPQP